MIHPCHRPGRQNRPGFFCPRQKAFPLFVLIILLLSFALMQKKVTKKKSSPVPPYAGSPPGRPTHMKSLKDCKCFTLLNRMIESICCVVSATQEGADFFTCFSQTSRKFIAGEKEALENSVSLLILLYRRASSLSMRRGRTQCSGGSDANG